MSPLYVFLVFIFHFGSELCSAKDIITSTQFLRDPESIVSNNSIFKLGFFSPPNSTFRYVGIWYNHPSTMEVVWVANRNNPIADSSGVLKISDDGNLQISNGLNQVLWSSNVSHPATRFSLAQLQNSGNFVLQVNGTVIWQSSQHPTDSILPNMWLTLERISDLRHVLQSWKSPSDPSTGRFSVGTDSSGLFQIIIFDGDRIHWQSGPWNGNIFIGTRYHNTGYGNIFINSGSFTQEVDGGMTSLVFIGANESLFSHYALSYEGLIAQKWWDDTKKKWEVTWKAPETECDIYGTCGQFASCNPQTSPMCSCLRGFEPKNEEEWKTENWSSGCVRGKQLQCGIQGGEADGFLRLQNMKVPQNPEWTVGLNLDQCRSKCFNNCSCLAYAYDTGIACMTWSGSLIDIAVLSPGGADLYLRLPQSELESNKTELKVVIAVSVIVGSAAILVAILCFLWKWKARRKGRVLENGHTMFQFASEKRFEAKKGIPNPQVFGQKSQVMTEDLELVTFEKLAEATNNFDKKNMLGSGGFGQVYKGKLEDGQTIAVKRLSRASGQGIEEFMNEVSVISKLQHRNLVKLLGCCAEGEEKMLIYEYMPNNSLDAFLFDPDKCKLDWGKGFNIIEGICRGLVYLHRDSRLRIIHRDLKASNILLDEELNPKISDFGMARIFGGKQDQANTQRVVGTYGYMSPEYAMEGKFSEKSDVFSFGVLLLEVISGKKNSKFWYEEESLSLLGYAWKLWKEDNIISLIDPPICTSEFRADVVRCIHVGLLCGQEFAKDRPSISTVMSMIVSEIVDLPNPKQPGFIQRQLCSSAIGTSSISNQNFSTNSITITSLTAR